MIRDRLRRLWQEVGEMLPRAVALWCLALTAGVELFTCLLRFGFSLESQKHSAWMAPLTFGHRVHHGYWGMLLVLIAAFAWRKCALRKTLLIVGGALFFSDMIHHFLVLWPVTGSPEFHFRYY
jgi:hypothetical protein